MYVIDCLLIAMVDQNVNRANTTAITIMSTAQMRSRILFYFCWAIWSWRRLGSICWLGHGGSSFK